MNYSAVGIIFSGKDKHTMKRLTSDRSVSAIPFACRYRLIDFCLSNLVNAGVSHINIIANCNYRSLLEHIGSGKDWDLARRVGGINVISPYQTSRNISKGVYSTHLEALINMKEYINEFKEEYVVLMDTDNVLNINLTDIISEHAESGADITFVTKNVPYDFTSLTPRMMISSVRGKITDISVNTSYNPDNTEMSLNIFVMKVSELKKIIEKAEIYSETSMTSMLISNMKTSNYRTFSYDGYVASLSSFSDYYRCSMNLVNDDKARESLLGKRGLPILTRVHNSSPTVYLSGASVKNSMLADECKIEGEIINSVIFRGVTVGRGAVVKNSVLFHGTTIGKNAQLNCIVTDKNVLISDGVILSGNEKMPFYIEKGRRI